MYRTLVFLAAITEALARAAVSLMVKAGDIADCVEEKAAQAARDANNKRFNDAVDAMIAANNALIKAQVRKDNAFTAWQDENERINREHS